MSATRTPTCLTCIAAVVVSSLAVSGALAATYYVYRNGSGDYPTIQNAIVNVSTGDTIMLGCGTFTGAGNRDLDYLGKAITIRSQNGDPADYIIRDNVATPSFGGGITSMAWLDHPKLIECTFAYSTAVILGGGFSGFSVTGSSIRRM